MGLGGYLAARTDQEHYQSEERREYGEVDNLREREVQEVETIFKGYGLEGEGLRHAVDAITNNRQRWVDFMMRFELGLERPAAGSYQRGNYRRLLSGRRVDPASTLHIHFTHRSCVQGVCTVDGSGACRVRRSGAVDRPQRCQVECADGGRWWHCRRSGLLPRVTVRVIAKRVVRQDVLAPVMPSIGPKTCCATGRALLGPGCPNGLCHVHYCSSLAKITQLYGRIGRKQRNSG